MQASQANNGYISGSCNISVRFVYACFSCNAANTLPIISCLLGQAETPVLQAFFQIGHRLFPVQRSGSIPGKVQEIVSRNTAEWSLPAALPLDEPIPQGETVAANQEILFQIV